MEIPVQPYGDLSEIGTTRVLRDAVGGDVLAEIVQDYFDLLETSTVIYEANGDDALGIFGSAWCRFLHGESRDRSGNGANPEARTCDQGPCHDACWETTRQAMELGHDVDRACAGGIRVFALPIMAGGEVVGGICIGHGDPPRDPETLQLTAERYGVDYEELRRQADAYESRSPAVVEAAKRRLRTSARLIGEIVERRRAEQRHERAQERVEAILARITDGFLAVDRAWTITYANVQAAALVRKTREEMVGTNLWSLFPEAIGTGFDENYRAALATQTALTFEEFYPPLGVWYEVHVYPSDEGLSIVFRDVTERRRRDDLLRENERRFRTLAEALPQLVWITGPDGAVTYFNRRWYDTIGTTPEESLGNGWSELVHPDDRQRCLYHWNRATLTGEPYEVEYRLRVAGGSYRWFLGRALPVMDELGWIESWFGTSTDIEAQKRPEEELRRSQERLKAALAASETGTYRWDLATGMYLDFDENLKHLFGIAPRSPCGPPTTFSAASTPTTCPRSSPPSIAAAMAPTSSWSTGSSCPTAACAGCMTGPG